MPIFPLLVPPVVDLTWIWVILHTDPSSYASFYVLGVISMIWRGWRYFFTLLINHYPINGDPWPLLMRGEYLTSRVPTPNWIAPFYISLQSSSFILCYKVVPPCTTMLNSKGLYRDALSRYKRFWYQNSPSWFLRYSFILCGNIHLLYPKYASPITFRIYVLNWHWWRGNLQAIYDSVPTTAYDITLFT